MVRMRKRPLAILLSCAMLVSAGVQSAYANHTLQIQLEQKSHMAAGKGIALM